MSTMFLFWAVVALATVLVGLLAIKFLVINPRKKRRLEEILEGFYGCTLAEGVKSCKANGIRFDSPSFRGLLGLRPDLVGRAYGALLKATGVTNKTADCEIGDKSLGRHDPLVIFLAEELVNLGHCPFTEGFIKGMTGRYPEYAAGLRKAFIDAEREKKKRSLEERTLTMEAREKTSQIWVRAPRKKPENRRFW